MKNCGNSTPRRKEGNARKRKWRKRKEIMIEKKKTCGGRRKKNSSALIEPINMSTENKRRKLQILYTVTGERKYGTEVDILVKTDVLFSLLRTAKESK